MQDTETKGQAAEQAGDPSKLQTLFAEVTALAHQLRKNTFLAHEEGNSPTGGWAVLEILERLGPQTVPAIARHRGLSRQSIQIQVNRLEAQGCAVVAPNPAHKRSGLVQLTDAGRKLLAAVTERKTSSLEGLLPCVPEARLVPATRLLRRIRELLVGKELPPVEAAGGKPTRRRGRGQGRPARAKAAATVTAPPAPLLGESSEADEGEFPVSLL